MRGVEVTCNMANSRHALVPLLRMLPVSEYFLFQIVTQSTNTPITSSNSYHCPDIFIILVLNICADYRLYFYKYCKCTTL